MPFARTRRPLAPRLRRVVVASTALLAACAPDRLPTTPRDGPGARPARATVAAVPDNAVVRWSSALMAAVRAERPSPTVVARAIAVLHTATYDAWAAYDATAVGTQLGGTLRRPAAERTVANKEHAVSVAAHRVLVDLFPAQAPAFDALLRAMGHDPADPSLDPATPAGVGRLAADAVLAMRHHDGANQRGDLHAGAYSDYTGYAPLNTVDLVVDPTRWQPLRVPTAAGGVVVQQFTTPHWSRVTPFALTSASQFRPDGLAALVRRGATEQQVEDMLRVSAGLDDEQKAIAEYWSDGPASELPPGHWCLFAAWVSRRDAHTIDQDAKLFFALGNAELDASIAAWDAKRAFDGARPITAVRLAKAGKPIRAWGGPGRGTVLMRGEEWQPYQVRTFVTPPFPEFVSGHSTFSAASATILARFAGSDAFGAEVTIPAGSSRIEPGVVPARPVTLRWATFSEAADQAGLSRRYGGIHFREGDEEGRRMGRAIGAQVWAKALTYFDGSAPPGTLAAR